MRFLLPINHRWGVMLNMTTVLLLSWHKLVASDTFECGFESGLCGMELRSEGGLAWTRQSGSTPSDNTGPASANGGLHYIYTEASVGNNGDKAYISTPALNHSGPLCISFRYHLYGFHIGRLKVFMEKDGEDRTIFNKTKSNSFSGDNGWHQVQITLPSVVNGDKVVFLGVRGDGVFGDMALDDVTVNDGACFKLFECGFESGLCGMAMRSEGGLAWTRQIGSTPSDNTGPASASGSRYYIYTEASVGNNGDKAYISTPVLNHSGPLCISFRYHLYGFHIGRLKVFMEKDGEDRTIFSKTKSDSASGDNGWHEARITLPSVVNGDKVVFLGVRGDGVLGDMALDDVTVNDTACFRGSRCSYCEQFCIMIDADLSCECYGGYVRYNNTHCKAIPTTTAPTTKPTTPILSITWIYTSTPDPFPRSTTTTTSPTTTTTTTSPTTTPTTTSPTTTPTTTSPTTTPTTRASAMSTTPSTTTTTTSTTPKVSSPSSRAAANTPRPSTTPRSLTPGPTTTRHQPTMAQEGDTGKSGDGTGRGNQQDINMAGLAGGVVGGLVLLALIPVVVYLVLRLKKKKNHEEQILANQNNVEAQTSGVGHTVEDLRRKALQVPHRVLDKPQPVYDMDRPKDGDMDSASYLRQSVSKDDFPSFVAAKLASGAISTAFQRCSTPSASSKEAMQRDFKSKNRFKNILPFDHNRVKLSKCDGDPFSDYINASFIKLYNEDETFIASVGPVNRIFDDFWRLIWEQSVAVIVMLTNLVEAGTMACEQYWPSSGSHKFGAITVHLVNEDKWPDYVIRNFRLEMTKGIATFKARPIKQLHFTSWPDLGVPQDATAVLRFHRKMRKYMFRHKTTLIHCSAGVGRTGTFMAIDHLLHQLEDEGAVGVHECVTNLRAQRQNMVQSEAQYRFIHEALVEVITLGNTTVPSKQFTDYSTGDRTAKEYQTLEYMTTSMTAEDEKLALSKDNKAKNVSREVIPRLSRRSFLLSHLKRRTDYINAVFVHAYQKKDAFIVTQTPLADTEVDFWRLLHDYRAGTVVILDPQRAGYLPNTKQRAVSREPYRVTLTREPEGATGDIVEFSFNVTKADGNEPMSTNKGQTSEYVSSRETDCPYMNAEAASPSQVRAKGDAVSCRAFHLVAERYTDLTSAMLSDLSTLVTTAHTAAPDTPVVLVSRDGAELCGMVVVFFCLLEMIQKEPEVDIFYMVKQARDSRPQFIASQAQYRYMYKLLEDYLR